MSRSLRLLLVTTYFEGKRRGSAPHARKQPGLSRAWQGGLTTLTRLVMFVINKIEKALVGVGYRHAFTRGGANLFQQRL